MSLKGNFYQALQELLAHGGLVGSDLEEKAKSGSELDSYLETAKEPAQRAEPETARPAAAEADNPPAFEAASAGDAVKEPAYFRRFGDMMARRKDASDREAGEAGRPQAPGGAFGTGRPDEEDAAEELTVISKNSFLDGSLRSFANVAIEGGIRGKLNAFKNVSITGMLIGDLACANVNMKGSSIQGNVSTKESAFLDRDATLLGDLAAQYASIDGRVRGNVEIGGKTEFGPNAVVLGDIKTGTICIADGANIQGFVTTAFLAEHGDTTFPSEIVIDDMGR